MRTVRVLAHRLGLFVGVMMVTSLIAMGASRATPGARVDQGCVEVLGTLRRAEGSPVAPTELVVSPGSRSEGVFTIVGSRASGEVRAKIGMRVKVWGRLRTADRSVPPRAGELEWTRIEPVAPDPLRLREREDFRAVDSSFCAGAPGIASP